MRYLPERSAGDVDASRREGRASGAARLSGALFAGAAAFQVGLVAGMPWGEFAWGGANPGVLSTGLRIGSAGSAVVLAGLGVALAGGVTGSVARRRVITGALVFSMASALANAITPSSKERAIWVPFALVQLGLLFVARRRE